MRLVLQTNIAGLISIWVVKRETVVSHIIKKTKWHGADKILVNIETALFKSRNNINDVENIIVVRGPGPFTAVRSGIIVANTLGMMLSIPVRGIVSSHLFPKTEIIKLLKASQKYGHASVRPWYGRQPNITRSRK